MKNGVIAPIVAVLSAVACAAILTQAPVHAQVQAADPAKSEVSATTQRPLPIPVRAPAEAPAHLQSQLPARVQAPPFETVRRHDARVDMNGMPAVNLDKYLLIMHQMIKRYDRIMLGLLEKRGGAEGDADTEKLAQDLAKLQPPPELTSQHEQLMKSLGPVDQFIKAGGTGTQGFDRAIDLAKQMQGTSSNYHDAALAMLEGRGLPLSADPFIAEGALEKRQSMRAARVQPEKVSAGLTDGVGRPVGPAAGLGISVSNGASGSSNSYDSPSMINGVDGSLGMSGLFNGMGGTGTNGLVDGMGFSSGLNGLVNGAGSSSGMSGMLNDTGTGSP